MTRESFYLAMRLVIAAQNNLPLDVEATPVSRPKMADAAAAPEQPQQQPQQPPPQQQPFAQYAPPPVNVSDADRKRFDEYFAKVDTAGTGFLFGDLAQQFFANAGLDAGTIGEIQRIADLDKDGKLSQREFAIAMTLVEHARTHQGALPVHLQQHPPEVAKKIETLRSIENTVSVQTQQEIQAFLTSGKAISKDDRPYLVMVDKLDKLELKVDAILSDGSEAVRTERKRVGKIIRDMRTFLVEAVESRA